MTFGNGSYFDSEPYVKFTVNRPEIPLVTVAIYLVFVFGVPRVLSKPLALTPLVALWNLLLTAFSIVGASHTVPALVLSLMENGWRHSLCSPSHLWTGRVSLWVTLFIFSKFPELLDTVFLVLQKKKVIFLHWFHHVTVLLYCWQAYMYSVSTGLWFCAMNFSVHSIMYLYYFLTTMRWCRSVTKAVAPLITFLQTAQMVVGMTVTAAGAYYQRMDPTSCDVDPTNSALGLAMYFCYFVLFAKLFHISSYSCWLLPTWR